MVYKFMIQNPYMHKYNVYYKTKFEKENIQYIKLVPKHWLVGRRYPGGLTIKQWNHVTTGQTMPWRTNNQPMKLCYYWADDTHQPMKSCYYWADDTLGN